MGKKVFSLIIVLFAASIMIYSCGSDDGGSPQELGDMTGLVGNVRPLGTASLCGSSMNVTGGNIAQNSSTDPTYIYGPIETDQGQIILRANVYLDKDGWGIPLYDHLNVNSGSVEFQDTAYSLGSATLAMTVSGSLPPSLRSLNGSIPAYPECPNGFTLDVTFTDI